MTLALSLFDEVAAPPVRQSSPQESLAKSLVALTDIPHVIVCHRGQAQVWMESIYEAHLAQMDDSEVAPEVMGRYEASCG